MKSIPAEQIVEGLSEDLQDLIVREACVRYHRASLAAGLARTRTQEAALAEKKPGLFSGKSAKEEHEAAQAKLRGDSAAYEQAIANCDLIVQKTEKIIAGELEHYFEGKSDDFRRAVAAQKMIAEWDQAVALYLVSLKNFVMRLGIARNQMASGYDRKAGKFATGALEAFAGAVTAAKSLEREAAIPDGIAKRQHALVGANAAASLPLLGDATLLKDVTGLTTLAFETAQMKLTALIDRTEKLQKEDVPEMQQGVVRESASADAERKKIMDRTLGDIRAMADGAVDPARVESVFVELQGRFVALTG